MFAVKGGTDGLGGWRDSELAWKSPLKLEVPEIDLSPEVLLPLTLYIYIYIYIYVCIYIYLKI